MVSTKIGMRKKRERQPVPSVLMWCELEDVLVFNQGPRSVLQLVRGAALVTFEAARLISASRDKNNLAASEVMLPSEFGIALLTKEIIHAGMRSAHPVRALNAPLERHPDVLVQFESPTTALIAVSRMTVEREWRTIAEVFVLAAWELCSSRGVVLGEPEFGQWMMTMAGEFAEAMETPDQPDPPVGPPS